MVYKWDLIGHITNNIVSCFNLGNGGVKGKRMINCIVKPPTCISQSGASTSQKSVWRSFLYFLEVHQSEVVTT